MPRIADWLVRVYRGSAQIGEWIIQSRTEEEADKEASADIEKDFPDSTDWTMERWGLE